MMISVMCDWEVWEQRQGMPITPIKRRQQDETQYKVSEGGGEKENQTRDGQRDRDTDTETELVAMFLSLSLLIFFYEKNGLCWVYIGRVSTYFDAFLLIITVLCNFYGLLAWFPHQP